MLKVDLHIHSNFSLCGIHSVLEILTEARKKKLKAIAITDHGPSTGAKTPSTFFDRLKDPVKGITLLKGIEANPVGTSGMIDLPFHNIKYMDVILVGFHYNLPKRDMKTNTEILLKIMKKNPFVDIIAHPCNDGYKLDLLKICETAVKYGMAVELNNSKFLYERQTLSDFKYIIECCKKTECNVVISSDAHAIQEIGDDSKIREFLKIVSLPYRLIVNRTLDSTMQFIKKRKKYKKEV